MALGQLDEKLVVRLVEGKENWHGLYSFKLPRKYLHATHDETYIQGIHELHEMHQLADQVCRYDLDELDVAWLMLCNAERELMGELPVEEWMMERVLEEIEQQCHNNMQTMIKTVDGLGIEYDENVVCDVCRSVSRCALVL
ncbi:Protein Jade-1 [Lamellibrachia satsuma]|nr:Protein Jade-1 [Lamellibrachia satsuma]